MTQTEQHLTKTTMRKRCASLTPQHRTASHLGMKCGGGTADARRGWDVSHLRFLRHHLVSSTNLDLQRWGGIPKLVQAGCLLHLVVPDDMHRCSQVLLGALGFSSSNYFFFILSNTLFFSRSLSLFLFLSLSLFFSFSLSLSRSRSSFLCIYLSIFLSLYRWPRDLHFSLNWRIIDSFIINKREFIFSLYESSVLALQHFSGR